MTKILYLKKVFAKIAIFSIKMSESKIFFRLTQATNTYRHISRNIQARMSSGWKLAHDKVLKKEFHKKAFKKKKKLHYNKKTTRYSSKYLHWCHWYQWISVWKKDDDECFLNDKSFCVKRPSFAKPIVSSLKMSELEIYLWLAQTPNISM